MIGLSRLLYGLSRFPEVLEGLDVEFNLSHEAGNEEFKETRNWTVVLSDQVCEISTGGSVYRPDVGSDSLLGESLYIEAGGHRASDDMLYWIDGASYALDSGARISVYDNSSMEES